MTYTAPIPTILHAMRVVGGMDDVLAYPALVDGAAEAILEEAGSFASGRIAPLNRMADKQNPVLHDGVVTTTPGWKEAYQDWAKAGWNSLTGPEAFGGQGLPSLLAVACNEIWNGASLAFALNPLLTAGAIEALVAHGTVDLQQRYLPSLISGVWTGTMNLTEPQAGSDLALLRSKAERHSDGTYRISGQKIYITYGEHDGAENIIHLVLARLPDAPAGTRGISLFLVPKILPDGTRNDVRCHSIEHKLGIHGSPTCTMIFGDEGGATGWLIGEENRGLNCMFTMMNNARLMVGVQGVALAEMAMQKALHYARERRQGRAPGESKGASPILQHPDVKRMLLTMRAKTAGARALCMATAAALDANHHAKGAEAARIALDRASLLTPLAKAYATDIAVEVASTGIQIHGGMGFVEETGAAQLWRDSRILPIYEGTNGIQAIDLVTRKLGLDDGRCVAFEVERCIKAAQRAQQSGRAPLQRAGQVFAQGLAGLQSVLDQWRKANDPASPHALAGATPLLRLFATVSAGAYLIDMALAAEHSPLNDEALTDCCLFMDTELMNAASAADGILHGADVVLQASLS
jgi:acyl-CoA dehydrogenase